MIVQWVYWHVNSANHFSLMSTFNKLYRRVEKVSIQLLIEILFSICSQWELSHVYLRMDYGGWMSEWYNGRENRGANEQRKDGCGGHQGAEPFLPHCGLHLRLLDCRWNICRGDGKIANVGNWQNKSSNISQTESLAPPGQPNATVFSLVKTEKR